MMNETLDDYEPLSYEDEQELIAIHVARCTKDGFCEICQSY